jgi:hypothetical protein
MSKERYIIKIFSSHGNSSLSFKMKTAFGDKENFLQEIKNYTDWEEKLNLLHKQSLENKGCITCGYEICMCDFQ